MNDFEPDGFTPLVVLGAVLSLAGALLSLFP
ncbi:hypothetical protein ZOD2009_19398 [Haladaptatus paucihalophilus DX253]|uniref:Uncharacterized protein n=1 Tax=Haladaptatus paucihalophilus DX253 TaxID=797209 RepID=E7QYI9_HALPU|nr:hypothetical protein ZOD2009_19398 [Haladaptatus paucihalophilus DX253]